MIDPRTIDPTYDVKLNMITMLGNVLYTTALRNRAFYGTKPMHTWDYDPVAGPRAAKLKFRAGLDGERVYNTLTGAKLASTRALFNGVPGWALPADPIVDWEGDCLTIEALFPSALQIEKVTLDNEVLRPNNGKLAILGLAQDWEYITLQYNRDMGAHTLIVGATGSGKTVTATTIACQLARGENVQFAMIDGKGGFDGLEKLSSLKGLVGPLAFSKEDALAVLNWALREMERRDTAEKCQYPIHLYVDELQEYTSIPEFSQGATRLGRMGRSKNIHLTFMTQRPDKNMWGQAGTSLKGQFLNVIMHALSNHHDVQAVTGTGRPPAHLLSGPGDAYFMNPTVGVQRVQIALLSERDYSIVTGSEPGNQWNAGMEPNTKFSARQQMASVYIASVHAIDNRKGGRGMLQTLLDEISESEKSNQTADELLQFGRDTYSDFQERLNV